MFDTKCHGKRSICARHTIRSGWCPAWSSRLVTVCGVVLTFLSVAMGGLEPARPLPDITSTNTFVAYYGYDYSAPNLAALAQYDVVVLHPAKTNCTPAVVAHLQNSGVRYVLAYITIGEEHPHVPVVMGDGDGPVYCDENGVIVTGAGGVYNDHATNLVLDGSLEDWVVHSYVSFGPESSTDADPDDVNWVEAYWAHDDAYYYLAYQTHDAITNLGARYQVYMDTDLDSSTGYRGPDGDFSIGADYTIQGTNIYVYTGTGGTNWAWAREGSAEYAVSGGTVEMRFPKDWMGNPTNDAFRLIFHGDDASRDVYPDHALDGGFFSYPIRVASFYVDQTWSDAGSNYVHNGRPDMNPHWNSRYIYPNEEWRDVLNRQRIGGVAGDPDLALRDEAGLEQIVGARVSDTDTARTNNFGFDGFFLDTIDTAGPYQGVGSYPWAAEEMSKTIRFIRETYTNSVIFANRGFFYSNPNLVDDMWGVRPYDYAIRPFIHAAVFESYMLDSSDIPGISPWFDANKSDWAPKVNAEANRHDGFTMFCLDYQNNRNPLLYDRAIQEAAVSNGWIMFLAPNHAIDEIADYVLLNPPAPDTSAPVWHSTAAPYPDPDPEPRVGLQDARLGPRYNTVVLHWDVAHDQTPPVRYDLMRATNESFTGTVMVHSNVAYEIGDGWGTEETAYVYPNKYEWPAWELEPGTNYFRVRARDSSTPEGLAEDNTVTLPFVLALPPGISNPSSNIVLNGNLGDWEGLDFFPPDFAGDGTTDSIDWRELAMAHDAFNFYIAISNHYPLTGGEEGNIWDTAIYLDTDSNRDTGFRGGAGEYPIGADYMVHGNNLLRYIGDGTDWEWVIIRTADWFIDGHTAEYQIPRAWLGEPEEIRLFAVGNEEPETLDYMPDDALAGGHFLYVAHDPAGPDRITNPNCHIVADGHLDEWAGLTFFPADPADVPEPESLDWRELAIAHDETHFYLAFSNAYPLVAESNIWNVYIYLDADLNRNTGFRGTADDFPIGADYVLFGHSLLGYTGDGTSWSWTNLVGTVNEGAGWAIDGHTAECLFPRAWLGMEEPGAEFRLFAEGQNPTTLDYMPDDALTMKSYFLYYVPDPWMHDTDGDGLPDGWEYLYFGCYTNANPHADDSGNDVTNWEHYVSNTNPTDPASFFAVQWAAPGEWEGPEERALRINTETDRIYAVDRASSPEQQDWEQIVDDFWGAGSPVYVPKTNFVPHRVYRGRVRLPGEPFPE